MTKLKTMFGLCALAALAVCAFAAQAASANQAYECTKEATSKTFSDAHCKTSGGTEYGHKILPAGKNKITLTNITTGTERSTAKLKSVQSGVTLELQSSEVEGEGELENGSGFVSGTGVITFKKVIVTAPAGKGCVVKGGTVTTNKLAGTTNGLAANLLKFSPASGTAFASFFVEGCSVAALNHEYTATGSVIGTTTGTTTAFTHTGTTEQGTLFLQGQKAGLEGTVTIKSAATGNGIALT
jgi:hypothetical protein